MEKDEIFHGKTHHLGIARHLLRNSLHYHNNQRSQGKVKTEEINSSGK